MTTAKIKNLNFGNHLDERVRDQGVGLLDEIVEGGCQPAHQSPGHNSHRLRILMREQGQQGRERTETGRKKDKKWQLLFRVNRDVVK